MADGETPQTAPGGGCRGAAPRGPPRLWCRWSLESCSVAGCHSPLPFCCLQELRRRACAEQPSPGIAPCPPGPGLLLGPRGVSLPPAWTLPRHGRDGADPPLTGDPAMPRAVSCQWPERCFSLSRRVHRKPDLAPTMRMHEVRRGRGGAGTLRSDQRF